MTLREKQSNRVTLTIDKLSEKLLKPGCELYDGSFDFMKTNKEE
jgi:hypothetical protein